MADDTIRNSEGGGSSAAGSCGRPRSRGAGRLQAEPVLRDLNRNLNDLLGSCPLTADGSWVVLRESTPGVWCLSFPDLPVAAALRLSTALAQIDERVGLAAVAKELPAPQRYDLCDILGTAPAVRPSTVHVEVPR